jgi:very-short-patch-repair endonuclease
MRHSNRHALPLRRQMTKAEVILWSRLRRKAMHGLRIRRQHPIGPYIADFACLTLRIVIEIDGATHGSAEEIAYDKRRQAYLQRHGFRVLRFWNQEIYENLEGVLAAIWNAMQQEVARRSGAPSGASHHLPRFAGEER